MKRLCPVCFTELPENANYCPVCGKCMREVVEHGVERDIATLSAEEREKIVNELNRVAVGYLGYQKEKTA